MFTIVKILGLFAGVEMIKNMHFKIVKGKSGPFFFFQINISITIKNDFLSLLLLSDYHSENNGVCHQRNIGYIIFFQYLSADLKYIKSQVQTLRPSF